MSDPTPHVRRRHTGAAAAAALLLSSCSAGPEPGDLAGWNVLLITIDTLRADRVGFAGYDAAETPALDGLAESGVVFRDAVSAAPVTLPSHATILTGLYPPAHGALDNGFYSLPDGVPTLATILKSAGYRTGAVIAAFVLHGQYGLDAGFDTYDDFFRQPRLPGQEHVERRASEVTARARELALSLDANDPFFLWVHYFDPHSPYDPPEPYRSAFAGRPYDGEIAYADHEIGQLLESVRSAGRMERTLVVVAADHGEAFGDGGEDTHGLLLRGSTLRVPFVMSAPGGLPERRRVDGVVSTADVTPTVLALLGLPAPDGLEGRSLVDAIGSGRSDGRQVYSETRLPTDQLGWSMLAGARSDRWAWVRAPRPELYDLKADPGESRSVHAEQAAAARELDAVVERTLARQRDVTRQELSPEETEALRALGYVSTDTAPVATGADPKDMLGQWKRLEELQSLAALGRHEEVLPGIRALLRDDPGNREARMLLGQSLIRTGKADEGIAELERVLQGGGNRGRTGTAIAQALAEAGRPEKAEAIYRALAQTEPELSEHPFNLGVLLWEQGRQAEALEAYEAALDRNPEAIHVLVNLAQALSRAGERADPDRAVEVLDRAIRIAPNDRPRLFKIYLCAELGRKEEGRRVARELSAKRPLRGVSAPELAAAIRFLEGA